MDPQHAVNHHTIQSDILEGCAVITRKNSLHQSHKQPKNALLIRLVARLEDPTLGGGVDDVEEGHDEVHTLAVAYCWVMEVIGVEEPFE